MSIDSTPSPEQDLSARIYSILTAKFHSVLESQYEEYEESGYFNDFDKPEQVKSFLKSEGIDTTDLQIETKAELKGYDYQDGRHGGDACPCVIVKISQNGKVLVEEFFQNPALKYEY